MCKFGGAEKLQGRHLVLQIQQFCDVLKVPLEAREAKERETKELGSDASQKKVTEMTKFPAVWGPKDGFC